MTAKIADVAKQEKQTLVRIQFIFDVLKQCSVRFEIGSVKNGKIFL